MDTTLFYCNRQRQGKVYKSYDLKSHFVQAKPNIIYICLVPNPANYNTWRKKQ